jgi:hypothetical protein
MKDMHDYRKRLERFKRSFAISIFEKYYNARTSFQELTLEKMT